jgi:hypothetical protein
VKSYPYSFLVQSFTAAQKNVGISRSNSPAVGGGTNGMANEDEGVDMIEIDGLLSEMAVMLGRWSLYSRFLGGKCRVSPPPQAVLLQALSKISQGPDTSPEEPLVMPQLLVKSALSRKISAHLTEPFNRMTLFFFRRSVEKAFQLDEFPTGLSLSLSKQLDGNAPYIISAVDDVMYIVNTVLQRSLSTSSREVVASVIPAISRVLGSDYMGLFQRKMRDDHYPKAAVQGGLPPENTIISFLVLMNSLDVSNDYISRIVTSRLTSPDAPNGTKTPNPLHEMFPFDHDSTFVIGLLESLNSTFTSISTIVISEAIGVLFKTVIQPRLRPVLSDTFRDVDYSLTEEDLEDIARQNDTDDDPDTLTDLVARRFEHSWDALMKPIQRIMTPKPYTQLLDFTAKHLARVLEKRIWGYGGKMNDLGAQRMERDFSGIIGVVARGGRYGVRDAFARVAQIAMLVNMEEEEWEALLEEEGEGDEEVAWVLSEDERRKDLMIVCMAAFWYSKIERKEGISRDCIIRAPQQRDHDPWFLRLNSKVKSL